MSLMFCDSFDHYTTILQKWDSATGNTGQATIAAAAARTGSQGLKTAISGGQTVSIAKNVTTTTTAFLGFAFNVNVAPGSTGPICAFIDGNTTQVDLRLDASGHLIFTRNGTVLGTSSSAISFGAWHYIEIKVTIDPSAGVAEVKVDGVFFLQLSGQNTRATSNSSFGSFSLGPTSAVSATYYYDDVYLLNSSGSTNNNYLGDTAVQMQLPTGDGSSLQWTPNSGVTHYTRVNENPPDDDTTYNSDATTGDIDYYTYANLPQTSGTVYAVVLNLRARKDDAGTRSIRGATKSPASTGTTGDNGSDLALSTSYVDFQAILEQDPNAGPGAWTITSVNAAEFGVKEIT